MTDNLERALGRVEGQLGTFNAKLDSVIVALRDSETKSDASRAGQDARLAVIDRQNQRIENDLKHALDRIEAMEPHVADMKRMRSQGIAVAAVLTTLGGIFGTTLYALKDKLWSFFAGS
jgi:putative ubiquitin-RnfH superfamily antitoxin RatB of RatAB toxin-antitoxin module